MESENKFWLLVIILFIIAKLIWGNNPERANKTLKIEQISEVKFTGLKFLNCGINSFYSTGFKGIKNGVPVEGSVCEGLIIKGSLIRYD